MSNPIASPLPGALPDAYLETLHAYDALNASLRVGNKVALLAALASSGITHVVVSFDGYGDSGQIETVEARAGDAPVDLPDTTVAIGEAEMGDPEPVTRDLPLGDAIEHLAYDCLAATHCGWENGDGAYGEFVFDVAAGTITLDHNDRHTAVETYNHSF